MLSNNNRGGVILCHRGGNKVYHQDLSVQHSRQF